MSSSDPRSRRPIAPVRHPLLRTLRQAWQVLRPEPTEVTATLHCPWNEVDANVTLVYDPRPDVPPQVLRCACAPSDEPLRCDKACLLDIDD